MYQIVELKDFYIARIGAEQFTAELAEQLMDDLKQNHKQKKMIIFDFALIQSIQVNSLERLIELSQDMKSFLAYMGPPSITEHLSRTGIDKYLLKLPFNDSADPSNLSKQDFDLYLKKFIKTVSAQIVLLMKELEVGEVSTSITGQKPAGFDKSEFCASAKLCTTPFLGSMVLGIPSDPFRLILQRFMHREDVDLEELKSGSAELLNIIIGRMRVELAKDGFSLDLNPPTVMQEQQTPSKIKFDPTLQNNQSIKTTTKHINYITVHTPAGDFFVEMSTSTRTT